MVPPLMTLHWSYTLPQSPPHNHLKASNIANVVIAEMRQSDQSL